ncbi:MAG: nitroreductase family protein [Eubacteriales bacterium]|nr:nitroreductase family protein [Eubacteriales bacterium]
MIQIDQEKCIACGQCAAICPLRVIAAAGNGFAATRECFACGHCFAVCPTGAVHMPGEEETRQDEGAAWRIDPNALLGFMQMRRSVRAYTAQKVEPEKLAMLLEAGRSAPTAGNGQRVRYLVLDRETQAFRARVWDSLQTYAEAKDNADLLRRAKAYHDGTETRDTLFFGGQQVILVVSPPGIDGALAARSMELMACALGLGTLYCGFAVHGVNESPALQKELGLEPGEILAACLVVGYPAVTFRRTVGRKPLQVQWR